MSWPSTTIGCQPNACQRRAYWSMSCPNAVTWLWPRRVDVGDAAQVVQLVVLRDVGRLPHRAFGRLAVAEQHVGAVVGPDAARVERDADGRADALAERAGGDVDERQPRRRVPLEVGSDLAQLQQFRPVERARLGPRRVEQRRGVPLRQHEPIVVGVLRPPRVEAHLREEQRGDDVGGRAAARRVAAAGRRRGANRVDSQAGGDVLESGHEGVGVSGHSNPPVRGQGAVPFGMRPPRKPHYNGAAGSSRQTVVAPADSPMRHTITLIPGDGIGPEVTRSVLQISTPPACRSTGSARTRGRPRSSRAATRCRAGCSTRSAGPRSR